MFLIRDDPEEGRAAMRFNCSLTAMDIGQNRWKQHGAWTHGYRANEFDHVSREAAENSVCLFAFIEASVRVGWNPGWLE